MSNEIQLIPPAKSLLQGLRCIGYSFSTALADIIDNSISANASNIYIWADPENDNPYLAIIDDGCGMTKEEIQNAMTLGSERINKKNTKIELGHFGLGLKSASFSQCLTLIVASKKNNKINAMSYDLEKIQKKNSWIIDVLSEEEIKKLPEIEKLKKSKTGTIVIWKNFDKIKEETEEKTSKSSFSNSFISKIDMAKKHTELIFHRFYNEINIEFNGHKINKIDPFLEENKASQRGREDTITMDGEEIKVTPFVLPHENVLKEKDRKLLGNPKSIYDEQGFYIYRNRRLIIWGSWLHVNMRSEDSKLARVRVDIPIGLDSSWMLDVKKSSLKIPDKIKDMLKNSVNDSIARSKGEIRHPIKKAATTISPLWNKIKLTEGEVKYEINREDNKLYLLLTEMLDKNQIKVLNAYLDKLERFIPKDLMILDAADSISILNATEEIDEEKMIQEILKIISCKNCSHAAADLLINDLLKEQSYSAIAHRKEEILRRVKNDR